MAWYDHSEGSTYEDHRKDDRVKDRYIYGLRRVRDTCGGKQEAIQDIRRSDIQDPTCVNCIRHCRHNRRFLYISVTKPKYSEGSRGLLRQI